MKRWLLLAACCAAAAGCSDSKVVVRASLDQGGQPIADLPVWLLPYDRKALADSMLRAGEMPEPAIPADLLTQLESLTAREKEAAGDSARRQVQAARRTLQARIDSIKTARRVWRERVFADFDSLARAKEAEAGAGSAVDTTDASGVATLGADEGRRWIWAVYVLPESTLEWHLPVTVRGDSTVVRLTRENAKERPFY